MVSAKTGADQLIAIDTAPSSVRQRMFAVDTD
jgi:hypothetical protein